jgi:iron complex transport system ATP-binding protein
MQIIERGLVMMDYQIKIQDLSFGYDQRRVLNNISLKLPRSGFISIVGPNGSGKSTLLKQISGALKPDAGGVYLDGKSIAAVSKKEAARIMAVVPQHTALEFDYRVLDVVLMGRYPYISRLRGETAQDRKIALDNMRFTNTHDLRNRSFNQLSGGERQRVILAQALTQQPKILLLDEPISHLDLQHQIEILNLIKKLSMDQNVIVVAVLHDLNMAAAYSDRIIMLKRGQVLCEGTPVEVLTVSNIKEVFEIEVDVEVSALTNKPYIYAIKRPEIKKNNIRVHVICGGGSGSEVLASLHNLGYEVSTGVLSIGDMDWKTAKDLNLRLAEDIPFEQISHGAYATNKALAQAADHLILTDLYIGKGNLRNLEVLLEPELQDKPLYILGDEDFEKRDATAGAAGKLYRLLKERKAFLVADKEELRAYLDKAGGGNE